MMRRRSEIVNFRVTSEELQQLRAAAEARGQHVSEFARAILLGELPEQKDRLTALEARVASLESLTTSSYTVYSGGPCLRCGRETFNGIPHLCQPITVSVPIGATS